MLYFHLTCTNLFLFMLCLSILRNFSKVLTVIKLKELIKSDQMNYVVILTSCGKSFGFDLKLKSNVTTYRVLLMIIMEIKTT